MFIGLSEIELDTSEDTGVLFDVISADPDAPVPPIQARYNETHITVDIEKAVAHLLSFHDRFARIKGIADTFTDEDQQGEHQSDGDEGCESKPRGKEVGPSLLDHFTQ